MAPLVQSILEELKEKSDWGQQLGAAQGGRIMCDAPADAAKQSAADGTSLLNE